MIPTLLFINSWDCCPRVEHRQLDGSRLRIAAIALRLALVFGSVLPTASSAIAGSAKIPVDVELVLAADVSGSMTRGLRAAQTDGFVAAFRNP